MKYITLFSVEDGLRKRGGKLTVDFNHSPRLYQIELPGHGPFEKLPRLEVIKWANKTLV